MLYDCNKKDIVLVVAKSTVSIAGSIVVQQKQKKWYLCYCSKKTPLLSYRVRQWAGKRKQKDIVLGVAKRHRCSQYMYMYWVRPWAGKRKQKYIVLVVAKRYRSSRLRVRPWSSRIRQNKKKVVVVAKTKSWFAVSTETKKISFFCRCQKRHGLNCGFDCGPAEAKKKRTLAQRHRLAPRPVESSFSSALVIFPESACCSCCGSLPQIPRPAPL